MLQSSTRRLPASILRAMASAQGLVAAASSGVVVAPIGSASAPSRTRHAAAPAASASPLAPSAFLGLRSLQHAKQGLAANPWAGSSLAAGAAASGGKRLFRQSAAVAAADAAVAEAETSSTEKFEYRAEVSRLLDLIIHSLYSHKEVFLRELVSNASDALDKLRFLSVTDPGLLSSNPDLEIRIKTDVDAGTITIQDTGIGMTREELVDSLGTIAQSGTAKFVQALKENKEDNNLIGQFGVGFYSAFLVADKVTVSTKSAKSDKTWVWEAVADQSSYEVREEEGTSARGTTITLHLKPEDKFEYTAVDRLEGLVKNYSQFISFPIYLWQEKTRSKEVVDESEPPQETAEGEEPKPPKMKTVAEKYNEWVLANDTKPIWMRAPKEVEKEEYDNFFKATFKEFVDPMAYTHFNTEGEIEFRSLLFIPGMAPYDPSEMMNYKGKNIRLHVKRVFISDEFDGELFPRYLNFVKGIVDSNDLPLNVSREILQESRVVRLMKKRLVRKTFDLIEDLSKKEDKEIYKGFWTNFGRNIKLGVIEDQANHARLTPLLRFFSSQSKSEEEELTSLDEYVERMKEGQGAIYYIGADSLASAKSAPFLEELGKKGFEVLYLVDPIDEVTIQNLVTYKDKKFMDITKEDLDLGDTNAEEEKERSREYQVLCDWWKQQLGDKVAKVQLSKRLASSPCVLVASKFGWSANMERLMKAQTMGGDSAQFEFMKGRRVLEINSNHPIIADLNRTVKEQPQEAKAQKLAKLLYETANLASGFTPESPSDFSGQIYDMLSMSLKPVNKTEAAAGGGAVATEAASVVVEADSVIQEGDVWRS